MAADRNGRENYTLIRDFMTAICLYGCLSREDFIALGISSGAAYDQCTRLLRSVVPELEGRRLGQSSRKYLHFPRQYGAARESLLTNTYLLHTIRPAELAEFLVLLQRLGRGEASQTQLAAELELRSEKEGVSKYNTARSHRMELAEWGSLKENNGGYRLETNFLSRLSREQLRQLAEFVRFRCQCAHPKAAGSFLLRSIRREMSARGMAPLGPMPVLLRRNDSCSIFDEDAAFRFRELIRQRKKAVIRCQGQCSEIVPVAVRVDKRLGRWYLLYWDGKPRMARLSNLTYVRDGARAPDWKGYARQVNEFFACSGVSAFRDEGSPYRVKVKVKLEGAMLLRFSRDIRLGQMEAGDTGRIYCVRINDPGELVPLLRQYAPGLEIQPGPDRLRQRIREDLLQMRSQLEEDL